MNYNLYLKYTNEQDLNINDDMLCDGISADILYEPEVLVKKDGYNPERITIGHLSMIYYNKALAMAYGVDMRALMLPWLPINLEVILEFNDKRIPKETEEEIGAATNPNILILDHFFISADWRNKGIGEQVMKGLIKQMKSKCGYIIIPNSVPQQHADYKAYGSLYMKMGVDLESLKSLEIDRTKAQLQLNAFWQRCGFRQFKNYYNVFICNVERAEVGSWKGLGSRHAQPLS
jgi:GNAT superfamily N-acetyltransferase